MPPLVMPCLARKPSSVCTSTSKIALPIPRTSYFAELIQMSCAGVLSRRLCLVKKVHTGPNEVMGPITILPPRASKAATPASCYRSAHDSLLPHGIDGNADLAAARLRARRHAGGAPGYGPDRGRVPDGVSTRQRGAAAFDRG